MAHAACHPKQGVGIAPTQLIPTAAQMNWPSAATTHALPRSWNGDTCGSALEPPLRGSPHDGELSVLHHIVSSKTNVMYFDEITDKPYDAESPDKEDTRWIPNVPIAL